MEIIEVIQKDFDIMENHNPIRETSLGMFKANRAKHLTAHGIAGKFIATLTLKPYLGYNGQVYPQLRIKTTIVKDDVE